jgi:hypothetical protein
MCSLSGVNSWFCSYYGAGAVSGYPGFDTLFVGGNLYWTNQQGGEVQAYGPGGTNVNLATGETYPQSLVTDNSYLYWVTGFNLMRMPIPDLTKPPPYATPTAVGSGLVPLRINNGFGIGTYATISTDGKYVYFAAQIGANQGIFYVPVAGGAAVELTPTTNPVSVLSVNVTGSTQAIFFADLGGIGTTTAGIYKVAPPP